MSKRDEFVNQLIDDYKKTLAKFVALKSVSATHTGIDETVQFLKGLLQNLLDADVDIVKTPGSPAIVATLPSKNPNAILFYSHYDVMAPGNKDLWKTQPFKLTEKNGKLYGRGAGDDKGQLLAQIFGFYMYKKLYGHFPFTIKLLYEGEEEQGSGDLPMVVKKVSHRLLNNVKLAIVIDGSINASGYHVLRLGNRGVIGLQITAKTGTKDNHSGNFGNIMPNAVMELHRVVNKLIDNQGRVKIPHFYDGIVKPSRKEIKWMKELPYDPETVSHEAGINVNDLPKDKLDYYKRIMFEPTFNISGFKAGYTGEGIKTIIPHRATLKMDCRLVAHQDIDKIADSFKRILAPEIKAHRIQIKVLVKDAPVKTSSENPYVKAVAQGIKNATGNVMIEPAMPGTVPSYVWSDILKVPVFMMPYANADQNNHVPNENLDIKAAEDGIKITYELVKNITCK